jgi:clan AA aspartic protease (TIGR02281 family)
MSIFSSRTTHLLIGLLFSCLIYADNHPIFYNDPIVKEATIEWPEPDPEENLYLDYDPAYNKSLEQDRPKKTVVNTNKYGRNHFITVTLVAVTGDRIDVQLMIDTGASMVVLPESMMSELGINEYEASSRKVQTVNGVTDALYAQIEALEIGQESVDDVTVAFIADESLGGVKLLGMNVLKNYQVTLDDKNNTLTLDKSD